ncbi:MULTISPECIES: hypothetical protein [unclassified Oceanispirochaeta]|uniref:hypothetical protein n=1 Tax=unclassified Oceanispirochaeta TaxID=2635722 RepID=UPI0011C05AFB|nr:MULTISPECIES: hypothetical protein [unclassified Oceanispirochaeta]MBF9019008.1 hypothetical protein [Oceanispirochaeta sp. M2]NPD75520.1 hypothetical protein [Oceanispirochaeta sp. M1]
METVDILERLEKLYHIASLHGWCNEVDIELIEITQSLSFSSKSGISEILVKNINIEKMSRTEYILTIVFLYKIDYPSFDLSEKLYKLLLDDIYDNDYNFIINQLFGNKHPFPTDMTNNMIRRGYLSYRRAINEAFLIDSVLSDIPPSDVVLYLTVLLCHRSLNDQNKAMVYFLLSRIDTELPEDLLKETMKYIYKLSSVITALEDDSDAVLSENLDLRNELRDDSNITDNDDDSIKNEDHRPIKRISENIINSNDDIYDIGSVELNSNKTDNLINFNPEEQEETGDDLSQYEKETISIDVTKHVDEISDYVSSEPDLLENKKLDNQINNFPTDLTDQSSFSKSDESENMPQDIISENIEILEEDSESNNEIEEDEQHNDDEIKKFNITFSKSLDQILKLAEQFSKEEGNNKTTSEKIEVNQSILKTSVEIIDKNKSLKTRNINDPGQNNEEEISHVTNNQKKKFEEKAAQPKEKKSIYRRKYGNLQIKIFLPILVCSIIFIFFLLLERQNRVQFLNRNYQVTQDSKTLIRGTKDNIVEETDQDAQETTPILTEIDSVISIDYYSSEGNKYTFILKDDKIFWKVNESNSFWSLYLFLSGDNLIDNKRIKSLGDLFWLDYLREMSRLNPEKKVLREIIPEENYIIVDG